MQQKITNVFICCLAIYLVVTKWECHPEVAILAIRVWHHGQSYQMPKGLRTLKGGWVYFSLSE